MPNPWESSSSQLKSTPNFVTANLMPAARLNDLMLLPQRSNWQEAVHDKFEEFAQGLGVNREDDETEAKPQQTRLRLAAGVSDKGRAPRLSHASIAQFQL